MGIQHGEKGLSIVTSTSPAVLFEADVRFADWLMFKFTPATEDLTALSIEVEVNDGDDDWMIVANTAIHFTSPSGAIYGAGNKTGPALDLTTCAADTTGWCMVEVVAFSSLRVRLTAAGDGTCTGSWDAG